jgi:hypothetical protein
VGKLINLDRGLFGDRECRDMAKNRVDHNLQKITKDIVYGWLVDYNSNENLLRRLPILALN